MMLPDAERASVDRVKITDYLLSLSHPDGSSKAAFFMRFGFKAEEWGKFAAALKEVGASNPVTDVVESPHGTRYTVDGSLRAADGRSPMVRTVRIVEQGAPPRLITAYPL
jgi:hypothetical protein